MMFIYTLPIFKTTFNIVQQPIQWQSTLSTLNQGSLFTYFQFMRIGWKTIFQILQLKTTHTNFKFSKDPHKYNVKQLDS